MSRAAKAKHFAKGVRSLQHVLDLCPHRYVGIGVGVPNQIHPVLSTAKKDIDAINCSQKSNLSLLVAAD